MTVWLLIVLGAIAYVAWTFYLSRVNTDVNRGLKCFVFSSDEVMQAVRAELEKASIVSSLRLASSSQQGYNELGAAQRSPNEIWISKDDLERVKELLKVKHTLSEEEFAIRVS